MKRMIAMGWILQQEDPGCAFLSAAALRKTGTFDFDFEDKEELDAAAVRRLVLEEMQHYCGSHVKTVS